MSEKNQGTDRERVAEKEHHPLETPHVGRESFRALIAMAVTLLVLGVTTYQIWSRYGGTDAVTQRRAPLTAERISASKPPGWVKSDIAQEVVIQGSLGDHDLSEPGLVRVVHQAFTNHPWVKKVKFAGIDAGSKVVVELDYRQPVASVVVSAEHVQVKPGAKTGLVPIDDEGVCLPDVTEDQANALPLVYVDGAVPPAVYGQSWTDKRVRDAALIVNHLSRLWQPLALQSLIAPPMSSLATHERSSYELRTKQQQRIIWGNPPGQELRGELTAAQKVSYLLELEGSLSTDESDPGQVVDLRTLPHPASAAQRSERESRVR